MPTSIFSALVTAITDATNIKDTINVFTAKNSFNGGVSADWVTTTFNTTQTLDASITYAKITATSNFTLSSVTNLSNSETSTIMLKIVHSGGPWSMSVNTSNFKASGATFPTLSGGEDFLILTRDADDGKWIISVYGLDIRSS